MKLFRRRRKVISEAVVEAGDGPTIAVVPHADEVLTAAVRSGGGRLAPPEVAEGLIWTEPTRPRDLAALLERATPAWVQLPFAGIEPFVSAGVIDGGRLWTCAKGIYGPATAEHAIALILAGARRLHDHARAVDWRPSGRGSPERRLDGTTALLVGTGGIGRAVVPLLKPFGVRIVAVNRSGSPLDGADETLTGDELPRLLAVADHVILAAASTSQTRGLMDRSMLEYMKGDAWLINVARGDLVVTDDLVEVLEGGGIGGAALDVTDPEPLPEGHPLWGMSNVLITPHVANTWDMALPELARLIERNVRRFAADEVLEGLVDVSLGY